MSQTQAPSFAAALRAWARVGLRGFGGPAAQIGLLHAEAVETGWVSEARFQRGLSFCALLPGPEAQQLATYLGWVLHGPAGAFAAGTLFVAPGAAVLLALSALYAEFGQMDAVDGVFLGLKCAVIPLVAQAVLRLARRALRGRAGWAVALAAGLALPILHVPFPLLILAAAAAGAALPALFGHAPPEPGDEAQIATDAAAAPGRARMPRHTLSAGLAALALWLVPVALLRLACPGRFADMAVFFSTLAATGFGGAYAVLAYAAQSAVQQLHWLSAGDMLAGLGLAETTPGPLVLVLQFVGFMAGFHAPGALSGLAGGTVAAALTLWCIFMPCFAFVLLGAPLLERLTRAARARAALAAIMAAVVGVMAQLALWFAVHVLFGDMARFDIGPAVLFLPAPGSLRWQAAAIVTLAAILLRATRGSLPAMLGLCAAAGAALRLAGA